MSFSKNRKTLLLAVTVAFLLGVLRELFFYDASIFKHYDLTTVVLYCFSLLTIVTVMIFLIIYNADEDTNLSLDNQENSKSSDHTDEHSDDHRALMEVGLMSAGMAHDFKNYLGILQGTSTIMEKKAASGDSISHALEVQKKCLQQALTIVEQINSYVKQGSSSASARRPVHDILDDAIELARLLTKEKHISIVKRYTKDTYPFEINDIALMRSVINLVKNATEASPENSQIVVSTNFPSYADETFFEVKVQDFGEGIDEKHLETLFKKIRTSKSYGTGLGLMTVKNLIEKQGGRILIESLPKEGSTFTIQLPLESEQVLSTN